MVVTIRPKEKRDGDFDTVKIVEIQLSEKEYFRLGEVAHLNYPDIASFVVSLFNRRLD